MEGRIVLITGSTRGVGREVARQLAELGATVLVSARDAAAAEQTASELAFAGDVRAVAVDFDVADPELVRAGAAALERDPGRLRTSSSTTPPPSSTGPRERPGRTSQPPRT